MDKITKKVIELLKEDARYSAAQIANMVNSDEKAVAKIVAELEESGVIVKYTTIINNEKAGDEYVDALIEVKVNPQSQSGYEAIATEIAKFDMVKNLYLMSGTFDLALTIEGKSIKDIALFVSEELSAIDSVVSVATHFIMKEYKSSGVSFGESVSDKREMIRWTTINI